MQTSERTQLLQFVYLWASYCLYSFFEGEKPEFRFMPYAAGYFETYEDYLAKKAWVMQQNPISSKEFCEQSDFIFYVSNDDIIEKIEVNRLVRIPVQFTDKGYNYGSTSNKLMVFFKLR